MPITKGRTLVESSIAVRWPRSASVWRRPRERVVEPFRYMPTAFSDVRGGGHVVDHQRRQRFFGWEKKGTSPLSSVTVIGSANNGKSQVVPPICPDYPRSNFSRQDDPQPTFCNILAFDWFLYGKSSIH